MRLGLLFSAVVWIAIVWLLTLLGLTVSEAIAVCVTIGCIVVLVINRRVE